MSALTPDSLRDYLKKLGWTVVKEALKDRLYVLEHKDFPIRQLVFPMDSKAPDFRESINRVFEKLSEMTGKKITMNKFKEGDRVQKVGGSYQATGTIVAAFFTLSGDRRYVFEFDAPVAGMLHIFSDANLEPESQESDCVCCGFHTKCQNK